MYVSVITVVHGSILNNMILTPVHRCSDCLPPPSSFFPTEAAKAAHQAASSGSVVDTPPHPGLGGPPAMLTNVPPPYQPVSVRHLDSESSLDEPQDYLWLVNCESKKPEPNRWVWGP